MEYVTLLGAEGVQQAGSSMQSAASDMLRASNFISEELRHHQQFLDEWLMRFESALKEHSQR